MWTSSSQLVGRASEDSGTSFPLSDRCHKHGTHIFYKSPSNHSFKFQSIQATKSWNWFGGGNGWNLRFSVDSACRFTSDSLFKILGRLSKLIHWPWPTTCFINYPATVLDRLERLGWCRLTLGVKCPHRNSTEVGKVSTPSGGRGNPYQVGLRGPHIFTRRPVESLVSRSHSFIRPRPDRSKWPGTCVPPFQPRSFCLLVLLCRSFPGVQNSAMQWMLWHLWVTLWEVEQLEII